MTSAKIAITNLSHRFTIDGREVRALDDVSLDVVGGAVVLTPHVAAGTGKDLLSDVREVLANVARVRCGEPALGAFAAPR